MIYLLLFLEFFKIGLLSFGGGYATLPFLYHISTQYGWFSGAELTRMLAISSITPGPVGLNVATFAGFKTAGTAGSLTATLAIMLPSFILVVIISKILNRFRDNFYVSSALYALRPATAAMLAAVCIKLAKETLWLQNAPNFNTKGAILLLALFILSFKTEKDPLVYLLIGGIAGIMFHLFALFLHPHLSALTSFCA